MILVNDRLLLLHPCVLVKPSCCCFLIRRLLALTIVKAALALELNYIILFIVYTTNKEQWKSSWKSNEVFVSRGNKQQRSNDTRALDKNLKSKKDPTVQFFALFRNCYKRGEPSFSTSFLPISQQGFNVCGQQIEHLFKSKPVSQGIHDELNKPFAEKWFGFSCTNALGMLMYIAYTQPDIQFAVHHCARFTYAPKREHSNVIICIAYYLCTNKGKGLQLTQHKSPIEFSSFVDADFCGLFGVKHPQPSLVQDRSLC